MPDNVVMEKALRFAVRIVRLYQYLSRTMNEYVMSKQLLRSGTSIGANIAEANEAFSKSDFIYKMSTALKECSETRYWIELLRRTDYLTEQQFASVMADCMELQKILTIIIKTARQNNRNGGSD